MEWTSIIVAVLGIVGGIDLLRLLFIKEDRKKKNVENKDAEVQAAQHANDLLSKQLERSHETITSLNAENSTLHREKAELLATQSCLFDDMCVHKGCRLRKPHQGQGVMYYQSYRDDPSLGADYHSVDTLIKMDRAARFKMEKAAEEDAGDED